MEVHPFHIKVCIVEPGGFNTGFTDNRNISEATRVNTDYKESFLKSLEIIEKEERNGCHPKKLGHAICKIVARKNPPFRTKVGPWIQVTFAKSKKWLPDVVMQYALRYSMPFNRQVWQKSPSITLICYKKQIFYF